MSVLDTLAPMTVPLVYINGQRYTGTVAVDFNHMMRCQEVHIRINDKMPEGLVLHSLDEVVRLWAVEGK